MSVFSFPRIHFRGQAFSQLPTGPRSGLLDLASHSLGTQVHPRSASDVASVRVRVRSARDCGQTGSTADPHGHNLAGSGHFSIDAKVSGCERRTASALALDSLLGSNVDLWGHFNPYLRSTFNRARIFDIDPASSDTATILVGMLAVGRGRRTSGEPYVFSGDVGDYSLPRLPGAGCPSVLWDGPMLEPRTMYQFVVPAGDTLRWHGEGAQRSGTAADLRARIDSGEADGLVVRFVVSPVAPPVADGTPARWSLSGTIAPWASSEPRTNPAGRRLVPIADGRAGVVLFEIAPEDDAIALDLSLVLPLGPRIHMVPAAAREEGHALTLVTASGAPVAVLPPMEQLMEGWSRAGCSVISVPLDGGSAARARQESLALVRSSSAGSERIAVEQDVVVVHDGPPVIVEYARADRETATLPIRLRTYLRGRPAAVRDVRCVQALNPKSTPGTDARAMRYAAAIEAPVLRMVGTQGHLRGDTRGAVAVLSSDDEGWIDLHVEPLAPGSGRLAVSPPGVNTLVDPEAHGSRHALFDAVRGSEQPEHCCLPVRVLPDHQWMDAVADEDVDFELIHSAVFETYEQFYSFMELEVFSLHDRCLVDVYPDLIVKVSDPQHRDRTFYMPPSRDLTRAQHRLLVRYLNGRCRPVAPVPAAAAVTASIETPEELRQALQHAVCVELTVVLQYLYAAWSIPTYASARHLADSGRWTPQQVAFAAGSGPRTHHTGLRGQLLRIAHEEMIHFLAANNVLRAVGGRFAYPDIDFAANGNPVLGLDLRLEPVGVGTLERFVALEAPSARGGLGADARPRQAGWSTIGELYASIREGLVGHWAAVGSSGQQGGGEHHLFMRESVNTTYPDFQLEVDDLSSALFTIDFIREQGEGRFLDLVTSADPSHHDLVLAALRGLIQEQVACGERPWSPALPLITSSKMEGDHAGSTL